ncbi:MAG: hypothetical protein V1834_02340, partial [Candidatus Micrarchaeota archaeon]
RALFLSFFLLFFLGLAGARSVSACQVQTLDGICCTNFETVYLFPSGTGCCIGGMPFEQGSGMCGFTGSCDVSACLADPQPTAAEGAGLVTLFLEVKKYYSGTETPTGVEIFCGPNAMEPYVFVPVGIGDEFAEPGTDANGDYWLAKAACEYDSFYFHNGQTVTDGMFVWNYPAGTGTDNNEIFFKLTHVHPCFITNFIPGGEYDEGAILSGFGCNALDDYCTHSLGAITTSPKSCCSYVVPPLTGLFYTDESTPVSLRVLFPEAENLNTLDARLASGSEGYRGNFYCDGDNPQPTDPHDFSSSLPEGVETKTWSCAYTPPGTRTSKTEVLRVFSGSKAGIRLADECTANVLHSPIAVGSTCSISVVGASSGDAPFTPTFNYEIKNVAGASTATFDCDNGQVISGLPLSDPAFSGCTYATAGTYAPEVRAAGTIETKRCSTTIIVNGGGPITPGGTEGVSLDCPSKATLVIDFPQSISATYYDEYGPVDCAATQNFKFYVEVTPDSGGPFGFLVDNTQWTCSNGVFTFDLNLADLDERATITIQAFHDVDSSNTWGPTEKGDDCTFYAFKRSPTPTPDLHWLVVILVGFGALFFLGRKGKKGKKK